MKSALLPTSDLHTDPALTRTRHSKVFEEHLRASISAIGLVEPIKVAPTGNGGYVVIDGVLRLKAFRSLAESEPERFERIPSYVYDFEARFELRFQSDIYQDLLPSQLAQLVEHLHQAEEVAKTDIARYIGVSPATLRNYTGLWRMLERGGLMTRVVGLMDLGVMPSSNPYAWLRLSETGVTESLLRMKDRHVGLEAWLNQLEDNARRGQPRRFTLKDVESATSQLPSHCYREGAEMRQTKKALGSRRGSKSGADARSSRPVKKQLAELVERSHSPVMTSALQSLIEAMT